MDSSNIRPCFADIRKLKVKATTNIKSLSDAGGRLEEIILPIFNP